MSFVPPSKIDMIKGFLYGKGLRFIKLNPSSRAVAATIGKPDYVPVIGAQIHEHALTVAKADPERFFYKDGRYCVAIQIYVSKWYGFEQPVGMAPEVYNYEVEALGGKLLKNKKHMPSIDQNDPLIKNPEDIDKVKTPIKIDQGRIRFVIDSIKAYKELTGNPPSAAFCAPFSFICGIHSYVRVIRNIRKNPEFIHKLLTWAIDEVLIPYLQLLKKETGANYAIGADAWAAIPNVNKEILENFVFPYNRILKEKAKKKGITVVIAASADYCIEDPKNFDPELMKWCWYHEGKALFGRPGIFMGMGKTELWPMEIIKEFIKENTSIFWKPPIIATCSASFIRDSSPYEIANYVKRIIDNLGRDGHLSFFLAQIPADTPPINVHSFVKASKTYGKYPIIENLNDIEFNLPEFKSYEEWYKEEVSKGRAIEYE